MAKVLQPITACLKKGGNMEEQDKKSIEDSKAQDSARSPENTNENSSLIWKMSSGLYSVGSGAVGLGVGTVKWAASTTYSVGTGVVSAAAGTAVVQKVVSKVIPSAAIPKPKKE